MSTGAGHIARRERFDLCDTFERVGPDAPTLCMPWTTRDLAAHLVVREGRPDLASGIWVPFLKDRTEREQARIAAQPWADLVEAVRSGPPGWHPTQLPAVDNAVNFAEMVVHHEDVLRGDGAPGPRREPDAHLEAAVWALLSRMGRILFRRVPVGVELRAPGRNTLTVRGGDETVRVTGAPLELLLTAYGRRNVAEIEVSGPPEAVTAFETARFGL
ncbi:TIGR03085 family metal-binding protein [Knoellia subterranea]|uniref:TIGR03085 family metal-binding protein n=1 Tax=Knoellia subterranea TaxID=184882 RepID=UPI00056552D7|nr:TIGR03085 family metal-binding protein [Knoellia subterranea]